MFNLTFPNDKPSTRNYYRSFAGCCGALLVINEKEFDANNWGVTLMVADKLYPQYQNREKENIYVDVLGDKWYVYTKLLKDPGDCYKERGITDGGREIYNTEDLPLHTFILENAWGWGERKFYVNWVKPKPGWYFLITVEQTSECREVSRNMLDGAEMAGFKKIKSFPPCYNGNYLYPSEDGDPVEGDRGLENRLQLHIYSYGEV